MDLGRDRKGVKSDDQTAFIMYKIWEEAIIIYKGSDVRLRYLRLLLLKEAAFDVFDAEALVSHEVAEILFDTLKTEAPEGSFYHLSEKSGSEVQPL